MNIEDNKRLVSVSVDMKKHPLWEGSMEQQAFQYGGLTVEQVKDRIAKLSRCDDLTPRERSWLALLIAAIS